MVMLVAAPCSAAERMSLDHYLDLTIISQSNFFSSLLLDVNDIVFSTQKGGRSTRGKGCR